MTAARRGAGGATPVATRAIRLLHARDLVAQVEALRPRYRVLRYDSRQGGS